MKKILLAAAMVMAMNLPVNATELPNVDLSGVTEDTCQIVKGVALANGELLKPISEESLTEMTDKVTDYQYRVLAEYFLQSANIKEKHHEDIDVQAMLNHRIQFKEDLMQKAMYGVEYFLENRSCTGI